MEPPLTRSEPPDSGRTSEDVLGRTWEMELLISGGVLFALFQLAAAFDRFVARLEPNLGFNSFIGIFLVYFIGKVILYILISSFILHLAARGYWIGLIGLQSVFPHGTRWDQVKYGPITKRLYQETMPPLAQMSERANAFSSVIFSFTATLVLVCVVTVAWTSALAAVAYGISTLLFGGRSLSAILLALLFGLTLSGVLGQVLDKAMGERLSPSGWPARGLRMIIRTYSRLFFEPLYRPILLALFSNLRKTTIYSIYYLT